MVDTKTKWFIVVVVIGIFLRLGFIWSQPPLEDDHLFVLSAENYMKHGQIGPSMIHHPNLRNILIYYSTSLFGKGRFGVWGVSLFFGIGSIFLLYLIGDQLFREKRAPLIASLFLAVDPLHIAFSRQAIQETTTLFFILLGFYLFLFYIRKGGYPYLLLVGVTFGIGIASKWQSLFPLVFCFSYIVLKSKMRFDVIFESVVCLIIVPFVTYLITFIPWFSRGFDLIDWFRYQVELFYLNRYLINPLEEIVRNPGNPLLWFIIPQGYASFTYSEGKPYVLIGIGNPFVWLLTIPAVLYSMYRAFKERGSHLLISGVFIFSYLPFVLASFKRDIYVLSALSIMPFVFLAIADIFCGITFLKRLRNFYLVIVIILSIVLYPLSIGRSLEFDYLHFVVEGFNPHK